MKAKFLRLKKFVVCLLSVVAVILDLVAIVQAVLPA